MAVTSANGNARGPASPMGCPYRWVAMPIPMITPTITITPLARGTTITMLLTPTPTTRSGRAPCASRFELVGPRRYGGRTTCLVAGQVL